MANNLIQDPTVAPLSWNKQLLLSLIQLKISNQTVDFNVDETGTHGTPEFPIAIYRGDITDSFANWHAENKIGYVEEGIILLECGNRKYLCFFMGICVDI